MKILVTLDGSTFSEAILEPVMNIGHRLGADVELLMIGKPGKAHATQSGFDSRDTIPAATSTGTRLNIPSLAELIREPAESREQAVERADSEALEYLHGQSRRLEDRGIHTTVRFVMADDAAEAIIEHARAEHVDGIAMATHGRTGLSHLLAGSVCERVIRSGVAPVLVLRPPL